MEIMSPKKKKMKTTTTTTTLYIPNDIIIEILLWLPAKSLLRLRWACKYWFDLITRDPDFIKLHLHRSTTINLHNPCVLILKLLREEPFSMPLIYRPPLKIFQCCIDYSTTGSFSAKVPILFGIFDDIRILGSCHGLILFSYYFREQQERTLCIWNPCTKEYKYLPNPPPSMYDEAKGIFGLDNFGLGYDGSIDDYKVIRNVNSYYGNIIHVQVYTLRTNSWRYIGSFTGYTLCSGFDNGVFVNGAVYFIMHKFMEIYRISHVKILSFNIEKEIYEELSNEPECLHDKTHFVVSLSTFEGSLCLTMYTHHEVGWPWLIRKDYIVNNNKESSWTKLYEFLIDHEHNNFLQPLRFTKNGEILWLDSMNGLLLWDPKNNEGRFINEGYKLHPTEEAGVVYTESLASLNSGTYIAEEGDYMLYWGNQDDYWYW